MAEETSHYAVVAVDDEGRQLARLLDGYIARPSDPASWEYFQQHPGEAAWFGRAMSQLTAAVVSRLAAAGYTPPAAERIVDVGGSRGTLLASLLRSAPDARGVVFDRAEALSETPAVLAGAGLAGRHGDHRRRFLRRGARRRPACPQQRPARLGG